MQSRTCIVLSLLAILSLTWGCISPGQISLITTTPTAMPVASPTAMPTASPTASPTATPTASPTTTPTPTASSQEQMPGREMEKPAGEIMIYPEEFIIYQNYLEVIGGKPGIADTGVIEATVMSIVKTEVCPYQEERCRFEPYPNDGGVVRVDKIINYTPYAERPAGPAVEQPGEAESESPGGKTSPGYEGPAYQPKERRYEPLREGQEVQTLFLLTARPAKVRYVPMSESDEGYESLESGQPAEGAAQHTAEQPARPEEIVFNPLPKEGDLFVFTTKVGAFPSAIERVLPGLEAGSKFRAAIRHDGTLYVEEYEEVMP